MNFIFEAETSGKKTQEWATAFGISKTLIDEKLSLGVEAKFTYETVDGSRNDGENKLVLGPSLQWRPTPKGHLDFVPLAGLRKDSPNAEIWLILGIDFGGAAKRDGYTPTNIKAN